MDDTERMLRDEYHAPEDFLYAYRTMGLWRFPGDPEFYDRTGEVVLDQEAANQRFDAARDGFCRSQPGEVEFRLRLEYLGENLVMMIHSLDDVKAGVDRMERDGENVAPAKLEAYQTFHERMEDGFREVHRRRMPSLFQAGYWWQRAEKMLRERFGHLDDHGDAVEFTEDDCAYLEELRRELAGLHWWAKDTKDPTGEEPTQ